MPRSSPGLSRNLLDGYYWEANLIAKANHFVELVKIPDWQMQDLRIKKQVEALTSQTSDLLLGDFYYYPGPLLQRRSQHGLTLLKFPPTHRIQVGFYIPNKGKNGEKILIFQIAISLAEVLDYPNYASEIGSFLFNRLSECGGRFGLAKSRENEEWFLLCFFAVYCRLRRNSGIS